MRYYEFLDTEIEQVTQDMKKLFRVQGQFSVDRQGFVSAAGMVIGLTKFAAHTDGFMPVRFKSVGDLVLKNCALISLLGCPTTVSNTFDCSMNNLGHLKAGPHTVGQSYDCSNNGLLDLTGAPSSVATFRCDKNLLSSLRSAPKSVQVFSCKDNPLVSLEGFPEQCKEVHITYTKNLPLLNLVGCQVHFYGMKNSAPPAGLGEIFGKYIGQKNNPKSLEACTQDLLKAGFQTNVKTNYASQ
jgi:hypothetical protein